MKNNWIPCSKRLPEESGNYLVTYADGKVYDNYYHAGEEEWCNSISYPFISIHGEVKAWMPFPPPPNSEESDELWISTSEKYPEREDDYLVSKDNFSYRRYYTEMYGWGDDWKSLSNKDYYSFWREMPEPYDGE